MKEEVRKVVLKLLEAGLIYPISDSSWVSPVQVVLKKGGMTVIKNDKDELIPTRTVTGWRMCIDYRKLNRRRLVVDNNNEMVHVGNQHGVKGKAWEDHDLVEEHGRDKGKEDQHKMVEGKKTILKSDHFPGCQNKRLSPQIDGAPNYRQVARFFLSSFS